MLSLKKYVLSKLHKEDSNSQSSEQIIALVSIIILLSGIHWLILILQLPVLTYLPYWFFGPHEQTIEIYWIIFAAFVLGLCIMISLSNLKTIIKLSLLILLGTIIQFSIGFSQGKGLAGIRDKIVKTGHAEFAIVATQQESMLDVAKNYEFKINDAQLGRFAPSKPPGSLLFYMLTERLSNFNIGDLNFDQRLENLRAFSSLS